MKLISKIKSLILKIKTKYDNLVFTITHRQLEHRFKKDSSKIAMCIYRTHDGEYKLADKGDTNLFSESVLHPDRVTFIGNIQMGDK